MCSKRGNDTGADPVRKGSDEFVTVPGMFQESEETCPGDDQRCSIGVGMKREALKVKQGLLYKEMDVMRLVIDKTEG